MSLADPSAALDALAASLAAHVPERTVGRSLIDPQNTKRERLQEGVLCVVLEGGGDFANYRGREADLGVLNVRVVGFCQVGEKDAPAEVERAELALLQDVLGWIHAPSLGHYGAGVDRVDPEDFALSKQLEHPYGWMTLTLRVRVR